MLNRLELEKKFFESTGKFYASKIYFEWMELDHEQRLPLPLWNIIFDYIYFDLFKLIKPFRTLLALHDLKKIEDNENYTIYGQERVLSDELIRFEFGSRKAIKEESKTDDALYPLKLSERMKWTRWGRVSQNELELKCFLRDLAINILTTSHQGKWSFVAKDAAKLIHDYEHNKLNSNHSYYTFQYGDINFVNVLMEAVAEARRQKKDFVDLMSLDADFGDFPIVRTKEISDLQKVIMASVGYGVVLLVSHGTPDLINELPNRTWYAQFPSFKTDHPSIWEGLKIPFLLYVDPMYYCNKLQLAFTYLTSNGEAKFTWQGKLPKFILGDGKLRSALGLGRNQSKKERYFRKMFLALIFMAEYCMDNPRHIKIFNMMFEYLPGIATTDILLSRKSLFCLDRNYISRMFHLTLLGLLVLQQHYDLTLKNPDYDWMSGVGHILLMSMVKIPRLLLGQDNHVRDTHSAGVIHKQKDSLGFYRGGLSWPQHAWIIPFAFAFIRLLDGNPIWALAATILVRLYSAYANRDDDLTWTPRHFRLPPKQFRHESVDNSAPYRYERKGGG